MMLELRACAWVIYWATHEPIEPKVSDFLKDLRQIHAGGAVPVYFWNSLQRMWPLLHVSARRQARIAQNHAAAMVGTPPAFPDEMTVNREAISQADQFVHTYGTEDPRFVLAFREESNFRPLAPIAARLGIPIAELVWAEVASWGTRDHGTLSAERTRRVLSEMEKDPDMHDAATVACLEIILGHDWTLDKKGLDCARKLLVRAINRLSECPHDLAAPTIVLFLKLSTADRRILSLARSLLKALSKLPRPYLSSFHFESGKSGKLALRNAGKLARYVTDKDVSVQKGALLLWEGLFDGLVYSDVWPVLAGSVRFRSRLGLSLIKDSDVGKRQQGIALLALSDLRISNAATRTEISRAMTKARERDRWNEFLEYVPIDKPRTSIWRSFLETLIAEPSKYRQLTVVEAKQRYARLVLAMESDIVEEETALGLPPDMMGG
jgi:hypothetical protein